MAIKETPPNYDNKSIKIAKKVKATRFGVGPEYKFLFAIDSPTNAMWRGYFAESLPDESRYLLEEVRQEKKARYTPVHFHRTELEIVCKAAELHGILATVKSAIALANAKTADYHTQIKEQKAKAIRALKLAQEEEERNERRIQQFFAELEI